MGRTGLADAGGTVAAVTERSPGAAAGGADASDAPAPDGAAAETSVAGGTPIG